MKTYHFAAVIEKDADGYYAFCPELQGCYTSGDSFEEARANLADAIRLHIEDRLAQGEEINPPESVNLTRACLLSDTRTSITRSASWPLRASVLPRLSVPQA